MTRSAPALRATATGMFATNPPSARMRPSSDSGAKIRGIAKLARTARARSPVRSTTTDRSARSAATARKGMGSESKLPRARRLPRSIAAFTSALTSGSTTLALWMLNRRSPCSHTTNGCTGPRERGALG
jgi:hypothetical protein